MPTPNEFVTSANAKTSLYITREETIQAISSIVPLLSSLSTVTFGVSPNPLFSTITMNPSGQINGYVPIQTSNLIYPTTGGQNQLASVIRGTFNGAANASLAPRDSLGNGAPITCAGVEVRTNAVASSPAGITVNPTGMTYAWGSTNQKPIIAVQAFNDGLNTVALNNISTINGSPPNVNPTTYTNLSGQNITNTGVITTPSMVSLSSLNGVPLANYLNSQSWVPYLVANTTPTNQIMVANQLYTVLTFTGLPITAGLGKFVNISVPILVSPASGSVAAQTNVALYAQIGGNITNSTMGVGAMAQLSPGSANTSRLITLSGVAQVNGPNATLQIQAVADQNVTLTFLQGSFGTKFFFQQVV